MPCGFHLLQLGLSACHKNRHWQLRNLLLEPHTGVTADGPGWVLNSSLHSLFQGQAQFINFPGKHLCTSLRVCASGTIHQAQGTKHRIWMGLASFQSVGHMAMSELHTHHVNSLA